jgi:glycosyltransferase involved in cell wall biosynthesis
VVMPTIKNWGFASVHREVGLVVERLRPDIVQIQYQTGAYGMQIGINLLPWLLRRQSARPRLVVTFHDLKEPYLLPKIGPARHLATVVLAAGADAVVVTNHEDFRRVASVVDPDRTRPLLGRQSLAAIPIGSNITRGPADCDRDAWRERLGAAASDFVIGFFGFLVPSKGVETLIAAFEALLSDGRPVRLAMVGASEGDTDISGDSYAAQIRRRLASPSLRDLVCWTGFASEDAVACYLRACDAVCLPFREGASLRHGTLAAAIAQGLPIVTSHSEVEVTGSGLPVLRDGENVLLVRRGDAVELARALARLADDSALRDRLKVNVARVAAQLDWRAIAEQHIALYRRVMAK